MKTEKRTSHETSPPYLFRRQIPDEGFHWIFSYTEDGEQEARRCLTLPRTGALRLTTRDVGVGRYREFADLDGSEEQLLRFANREGFLCAQLPIYERIASSDRSAPPTLYPNMGEARDVWLSEICDMRTAIQLWQAVQQRAETNLKRWIDIDDSTAFHNFGDPPTLPSDWVEGEAEPTTILIFTGDLILGQRTQHTVSVHYEDECLTHKSWVPMARVILGSFAAKKIRAGTSLTVEMERGLPKPRMAVSSLSAHLWLQFLTDISGLHLVLCDGCKELFRRERKNHLTCGETCRKRVSDKKKAGKKSLANKKVSKKKGGRNGSKTSKR